MFNNVGGKCKALAYIVCWLGIIGFVILGIATIASGHRLNNDYYTRGTGGSVIVTGWVYLLVGPLASWLSSLSLYAIGEAAENSQTATYLAQKMLEDKEKERKSAPVVSSDSSYASRSSSSSAKEWYCSKCGNNNAGGTYVCIRCGTRRSFR